MLTSPGTDMTDEEAELYRKCVWREASGEGHIGMLAVAWNIWNRHIHWNQSLTTVIMTPNQYTSMHMKNPRDPKLGDPQYADAAQIIGMVSSGQVPDPTNGGLYYANLDSVRAANVAEGLPAESGWFFKHIVNDHKNHPQVAVQGRHTFFL